MSYFLPITCHSAEADRENGFRAFLIAQSHSSGATLLLYSFKLTTSILQDLNLGTELAMIKKIHFVSSRLISIFIFG